MTYACMFNVCLTIDYTISTLKSLSCLNGLWQKLVMSNTWKVCICVYTANATDDKLLFFKPRLLCNPRPLRIVFQLTLG